MPSENNKQTAIDAHRPPVQPKQTRFKNRTKIFPSPLQTSMTTYPYRAPAFRISKTKSPEQPTKEPRELSWSWHGPRGPFRDDGGYKHPTDAAPTAPVFPKYCSWSLGRGILAGTLVAVQIPSFIAKIFALPAPGRITTNAETGQVSTSLSPTSFPQWNT
jgi:hypothetical protein